MSGPLSLPAWHRVLMPLPTEPAALTPFAPPVPLHTLVTFPVRDGATIARLDLTRLPPSTPPFLVGIHRRPAVGAAGAEIHLRGPQNLAHRHAMIRWDGNAHELTVMDLGSRGTKVSCHAWSEPIDLRKASLSIFVGTEPRSLVTLTVGQTVFLEIIVGDAVSADQCIYAMAEDADADGAELERLRSVLQDRYRAGARSVGLMFVSADCYAQLADAARALGMLVIPLLSDATHQRLQSIRLGDHLRREYGAEVRKNLDAGIAACREKLSAAEESFRRDARWFVTRGAPDGWPESVFAQIAEYQSWLHQLLAVQQELVGVGYDADRWNGLWEYLVNVALYEMQNIMLDTRPDFVIVDAADAEPLAEATGYRVASY